MLKENLNKLSKLLIILGIIFFLLNFIGCGGGKSEESSNTGEGVESEEFILSVLDRSSVDPIFPAEVTLGFDKDRNGIFTEDEIITKVTDETGRVEFKKDEFIVAKNNRDVFKTYDILLKIDADGYISVIKNLPKGSSIPTVVLLDKKKEANIVNEGNETKISIDNATIWIPTETIGKALKRLGRVNRDGEPDFNQLRASIGYFNPSANPENMPGDFRAYDEGDALLSSAGAVQVDFYTTNGMPVVLKGNFHIKMKVFPENYKGIEDVNPKTPEIEVPLWWFDEEEGVWKKYDTVGYVVDANGQKLSWQEFLKFIKGEVNKEIFIEGEIISSRQGGGISPRISWVNCDIPTKLAGIMGRISPFPEICKQNRCYIEVLGENWSGGQGGNYIIPDPNNPESGLIVLPVPVSSSETNEPESRTDEEIQKLIEGLESMVVGPFNFVGEDLGSMYKSDKAICREFAAKVKYVMESNIDYLINKTKDFYYKDISGWDVLMEAISGEDARYRVFIQGILPNLETARQYIEKGEFDKAFKQLNTVYKLYASNINNESFQELSIEVTKRSLQTINTLLLDAIGPLFQVLGSWTNDACVKSLPAFANLMGVYDVLSYINSAPNPNDPWEILNAVAQISFVKKLGILTGELDDLAECMSAESVNLLKASVSELSKAILTVLPVAADVINGLANVGDVTSQYWMMQKLFQIGVNIRNMAIQTNYIVKTFKDKIDLQQECNFDLDAFMTPINNILSRSSTFTRADNSNDTESDASVDIAKLIKELFYLIGDLPYTEWYDTFTLKKLDKLPPDIQGSPYKNGKYISKLTLTIPKLGIYRLPIETITDKGIDTTLIPSPGIYANYGDKRISAYIGSFSFPSIGLTNITFKFSISSILNEDLIFNSTPYVLLTLHPYYIRSDKCTVTEKNAVCNLTIPENLINTIKNIYVSFYVKNKENAKIFHIYKKINLTEDDINILSQEKKLDINLDLATEECKPIITSIEIPQKIEPSKTYIFKTKIDFVPIKKKATLNNLKVEWFLGWEKIGEGLELKWTAPCREIFMKSFPYNRNFISIKVCYRNDVSGRSICSSKTEKVLLFVQNRPPVIENLEGQDVIDSNEDKATYIVNVADPDNDELDYKWWFEGDIGSYLTFSTKNNYETTILKKIAPWHDVSGKVCVRVSDNLTSASLCKNLILKKKVFPPKIWGINKDIRDFVVPEKITFKVLASASSGHKIVKYKFDFDNDGKWDLESESNTVTRLFTKPGNYTISVVAEDDLGQKSNKMYTYFTLKDLEFNAIATAYLSYNYKDKLIKLESNVNVNNYDVVLRYDWDIDGNGSIDFHTYTPELITILSSEDINNAQEIKLIIETLYGNFEITISKDKILPYINFSATPSYGSLPLKVNFNVKAISYGRSVKEFKFDFDGDGSFDLVNTNGNATYTYHQAGNYNAVVQIVFSDNSILTRTVNIKVFSQKTKELSFKFPFEGIYVTVHDDDLRPVVTKKTDENGIVNFGQFYHPFVNVSFAITPDIVLDKDMLMAWLINCYKDKVYKYGKGYLIDINDFINTKHIKNVDFKNLITGIGINGFENIVISDYDVNEDGYLDIDEIYQLFIAVKDTSGDGKLEAKELDDNFLESVKFFLIKNLPIDNYKIEDTTFIPDSLRLPKKIVKYVVDTNGLSGRLDIFVGNNNISHFLSGSTNQVSNTISLYQLDEDGTYSLISVYIPYNTQPKACYFSEIEDNLVTFNIEECSPAREIDLIDFSKNPGSFLYLTGIDAFGMYSVLSTSAISGEINSIYLPLNIKPKEVFINYNIFQNNQKYIFFRKKISNIPTSIDLSNYSFDVNIDQMDSKCFSIYGTDFSNVDVVGYSLLSGDHNRYFEFNFVDFGNPNEICIVDPESVLPNEINSYYNELVNSFAEVNIFVGNILDINDKTKLINSIFSGIDSKHELIWCNQFFEISEDIFSN